MCTFCEHYVPPDTFRATQFRDLAGLDFPFHFFFVARFSFFFFVSWKPASNVCSCVLMCRWLAPLFTYARLLVAARSYAWNSKLPFDGRTFPPLVRWSHGHMVVRSDVQMVGGRNERRIAGILRRCLCEAFLQAIFHWIYMPPARREFSPLFVLQLP